MNSIKLFKKYCSPEWLPIIEFHKQEIKVSAKTTIFAEGDKVSGIYFIETGKVKVVSNFGKEDNKIVRLASDQMILGHRGLNSETYPVSAIALTETVLTFLPLDIFIKVLKANSEFSLYLINFISSELRDAEERMKNLLVLDPKQRVANILLRNLHCFGYDKDKKGKLSHTLTRTEYANMAGTTYETIIRTLALFEKSGLIKLDGKEIHILSEKKLQEVAAGKSAIKSAV